MVAALGVTRLAGYGPGRQRLTLRVHRQTPVVTRRRPSVAEHCSSGLSATEKLLADDEIGARWHPLKPTLPLNLARA